MNTINEYLFMYRKHDKSLSITASEEDYLQVRSRLYDRYADLFEMYSKEIYILSQAKIFKSGKLRQRFIITKNKNKRLEKQIKSIKLKHKNLKIRFDDLKYKNVKKPYTGKINKHILRPVYTSKKIVKKMRDRL